MVRATWVSWLVLGMAILGGWFQGSVALAQPAPDTTVTDAALSQAQGDRLELPFTDVPEDHWAYQALLNLAGVYGCVGGYPDGTFRGETAITRYEFAAGMESCLGVLNTLRQQQQAQQQQAVSDLIEEMEQSLQELRGLEERL